MVDFRTEKPVDVGTLAMLLGVNPITIRRWFVKGLAWGKLGGKVFTSYEALNRFQTGGSQQTVQAIVVDRETLAALKSLKARGFKIGTEGTDAKQAKAAV